MAYQTVFSVWHKLNRTNRHRSCSPRSPPSRVESSGRWRAGAGGDGRRWCMFFTWFYYMFIVYLFCEFKREGNILLFVYVWSYYISQKVFVVVWVCLFRPIVSVVCFVLFQGACFFGEEVDCFVACCFDMSRLVSSFTLWTRSGEATLPGVQGEAELLPNGKGRRKSLSSICYLMPFVIYRREWKATNKTVFVIFKPGTTYYVLWS